MPLKVFHDIGSPIPTITLDEIEFNNQEEEKFFRLTDSKKKLEIRIKFVPEFESDYDSNRFECYLFENPYLTAENDIFELKESTIEGRFGWIFPISSLDSNDNNYAEHKIFRHYRHIAYQKLLMLDFPIKIEEFKQEYRISELFEGLSICILSRDEILKLENFRISDYALSFLKYDYLIYKNSFVGKKAFNKETNVEDLRKGNHKLKIRKSAYDITTNEYINSLFIDHVYQTENSLTKYILLYQILEHFVKEIGDQKLINIIEDFQKGFITKNSLKEEIGKIHSDRNLVKQPIENANISSSTRLSFQEKCQFLFEDLTLKLNKNFGDAVYDLRNLITHNYRVLTGRTEQLNDIFYLFETIIIELLLTYNEKIDAAEELVVDEEIQEAEISEQAQIKVTRQVTIKEALLLLIQSIWRSLRRNDKIIANSKK